MLAFPNSINDNWRLVVRFLLSRQPSVLGEAMADNTSATREDYEELRRLGRIAYMCVFVYMYTYVYVRWE